MSGPLHQEAAFWKAEGLSSRTANALAGWAIFSEADLRNQIVQLLTGVTPGLGANSRRELIRYLLPRMVARHADEQAVIEAAIDAFRTSFGGAWTRELDTACAHLDETRRSCGGAS